MAVGEDGGVKGLGMSREEMADKRRVPLMLVGKALEAQVPSMGMAIAHGQTSQAELRSTKDLPRQVHLP